MITVQREKEIEERLIAIAKELIDIANELEYTVDIMASHCKGIGASPVVFVHPNDSCYSANSIRDINGLLFAAREATAG